MKEEELNKKQSIFKKLDAGQLENTSGGCFFGCRMEIRGQKCKGHDVYEFFKCPDCGKEKYLKNGKPVEPSEYHMAVRVLHGMKNLACTVSSLSRLYGHLFVRTPAGMDSHSAQFSISKFLTLENSFTLLVTTVYPRDCA